MEKTAERSANKAVDSIQKCLTDYACELHYDDLSSDAIHAAKLRVIDTFGALIAGFFGEPCRIARNLAAQMPDLGGATIIGTRMKVAPDLAAFVNATTARYPELNDIYHWPQSVHGHGSDALMPILAGAENARVNGRDFITAIVLAYEVSCRFSDVYPNRAFDPANFICLATAMAVGKIKGLSPVQLSHAISMAIVPNNMLTQARLGHTSMFKAAASGHAGRAGVFAALLAQAGMEGPHLPFEGKAGWCEHIAGKHFSLNTMGGNGTPFKILDTRIKNRAASGGATSSILAAEKVAPINIREVKQVTVEVYRYVYERYLNTPEEFRNPCSRETADHSIPYTVAVTLMDGTVTLRSYDDAHLFNPQLRALMQKIEVVENPEFTKAFEQVPVKERVRVTVVTNSGERLVGETGGDPDDLSAPKSDAQIVNKFRGLTEDVMGTARVNTILDCLWHLDELKDVAEIPPAFVLD